MFKEQYEKVMDLNTLAYRLNRPAFPCLYYYQVKEKEDVDLDEDENEQKIYRHYN